MNINQHVDRITRLLIFTSCCQCSYLFFHIISFKLLLWGCFILAECVVGCGAPFLPELRLFSPKRLKGFASLTSVFVSGVNK